MPRVKLFDEQEVLEKAMNLFWTKGYHATSMADLVKQLGINRASLYDTFGGKQQLFDKAFQHYLTISAKNTQAFLSSHSDVKQGLRKLFLMAIEESRYDKNQKGCFVVNTTTALQPEDVNTRQVIATNKAYYEKVFLDYLTSGVEAGQISKDKDLPAIAILLYTFLNGLRVLTKVEAKDDQFVKALDILLMVLN